MSETHQESRQELTDNSTINMGPTFIERRRQILEEKIANLKLLCADLDPYKEISPKHAKLLKKFNITELADPFIITNRLLTLMEDAIEEMESYPAREEPAPQDEVH